MTTLPANLRPPTDAERQRGEEEILAYPSWKGWLLVGVEDCGPTTPSPDGWTRFWYIPPDTTVEDYQ